MHAFANQYNPINIDTFMCMIPWRIYKLIAVGNVDSRNGFHLGTTNTYNLLVLTVTQDQNMFTRVQVFLRLTCIYHCRIRKWSLEHCYYNVGMHIVTQTTAKKKREGLLIFTLESNIARYILMRH